MTNIHEILSGIGITVPEDKISGFDELMKKNYKTVAEVAKIETARDNYKSQAETAQTALKSFEGVDVAQLKGEITKLRDGLTAKEQAHAAQLDELEFNGIVESELTAAKAKNLKAAKALLDVDALKASKKRWARYLEMMVDVGYIKGITVYRDITDEFCIHSIPSVACIIFTK